METVKQILEPIIVVGGFGAFIDFLIGKAGQERAKLFLTRITRWTSWATVDRASHAQHAGEPAS
jgi:hypothetical protein